LLKFKIPFAKKQKVFSFVKKRARVQKNCEKETEQIKAKETRAESKKYI